MFLILLAICKQETRASWSSYKYWFWRFTSKWPSWFLMSVCGVMVLGCRIVVVTRPWKLVGLIFVFLMPVLLYSVLWRDIKMSPWHEWNKPIAYLVILQTSVISSVCLYELEPCLWTVYVSPPCHSLFFNAFPCLFLTLLFASTGCGLQAVEVVQFPGA